MSNLKLWFNGADTYVAESAEPETFVPVSGTNALAWYHVEAWFLRNARPEQKVVLC